MSKVTQAHIDARTSDILGAANRLFARQGIDGTTMQEIAGEAGLSAGAIYRYYPSKEHLVRAVFDDCSRASAAVFDEGAAGAATPMEAVERTGRIAWASIKDADAGEQTILALEIALAAARRPQEFGPERRELARSRVVALEALIRDAQAQGEIDGTVDAWALAVMLIAAYLGSRVLALDLGAEADVDAVHRMVTALIDACRAGKTRVAAL